jgi:CubicO group peptidase (beta-lactamase class C family)
MRTPISGGNPREAVMNPYRSIVCRRALHAAALLLTTLPALAAPGSRAWPDPDWATDSPESQGVDSGRLEKLRAYLEERQTRAALVIRHGRIVGEWYWRGTTADTELPVFSVTKSLASTAIGLLSDGGKIRLDQPAADFISSWREDGRKAITIRHLVTMTSGLKREDYGYFFRQDQLAMSLAQPPESKPGTKWEYNNLACNCLSEIVAKVSGMEMDDFLRKRLFEPLGITHATMERRGGRALAYMGLHITARDLARVGYLFLNRGEWKGQRILSEAWVKEATRTSQDLTPDYGFLWWVHTASTRPEDPPDSYEAIGLYGNYLCVFPAQDMILVRLIGGGSGALTDVDRIEMKRLALAALRPPAR